MLFLQRVACFACFALAFFFTAGSIVAQDDEKMWCDYPGKEGEVGSGKRVVLIAGDDEYRSEEALPMLGKILSQRHGFNCSVLFPVNEEGLIRPNFQKNIPGMHLLKDADLVILGLRFRNLPDEQMQHFVDYLESGKPMIGVRTTTHAFKIPAESKFGRFSFNSKKEGWIGGFGQRVMGETWVSHYGKHGKESTRGIPNPEHAKHPVLQGVDDVWGDTDVYTVKNIPESATVLLRGQILTGMKPTDSKVDDDRNNPMMPVAWLNSFETTSGKKSRIFCTTMGAASDFQSEDLRRLVLNASLWCLEMEDSIKPDFEVDYVDEYKPTKFGFKKFQKDRKPSYYDLKTEK